MPAVKLKQETMAKIPRYSELSLPRQALLRLCQSINHGCIRDLHVRGQEPIFDPSPTVMVEMKLNTDDGARPELNLADFDLSDEVCRLLRRFDKIKDGKIAELEVRAGIPRRGFVESL